MSNVQLEIEGPNPIPSLQKQDWQVRLTDYKTGAEFIKNNHYARGCSNTCVYSFGLYKNGEDKLYGVALWLPPTKACAQNTYNGDWRRVLALSRLACLPDAPKNAESYLISKCISHIRKMGVWECLVTYADQMVNHVGGIYKASNWEYLGLTNTATPAWKDENGRLVARKAGPKTRTKKEMQDLGYINTGSFKKHKYRIIL